MPDETLIQETAPQEPESEVIPEVEVVPDEVDDLPDDSTEEVVTEIPEVTPVSLKVKFNHQEREFSVEEAEPLVRQGLKWDSFQPQYDKLNYLAVANETSVPELIEKLISGFDDVQFNQFLEEAGGNEALAKRLMDGYKLERESKYNNFKQTESTKEKETEQAKETELTNRIASGFVELQKEMPDKFTKITDVPKQVIEMAADKKIPLLDAYLRFERAESKRLQAIELKTAEAQKSSLGSLSDTPIGNDSALAEIEKNMMKAAGLL